MSADEDDLALLLDAAQAAGRLALELQAAGLKVERKDGGSPVTNGDLAADALLTERLRGARPDYGWLSEETADDRSRLSAGRVFIVDPIDGTQAYVKGRPWWVVAAAVVEDGRPVAAVVHAPVLDETYAAVRGGGGATLNGAPISPSAADRLEDCAMLGPPEMFAHPGWAIPWPPMRVERRNALAYRLCLVAAGKFDAAVSLGPKWDWDLAAPTLIAEEAGAAVSDRLGGALRFNEERASSRGVVCCAPALHRLILSRTAPIDMAD